MLSKSAEISICYTDCSQGCYSNIILTLDPFIIDKLEPWQKKLEKDSKRNVAETKVLLMSSRAEESNLANLIADSFVHYVSNKTP